MTSEPTAKAGPTRRVQVLRGRVRVPSTPPVTFVSVSDSESTSPTKDGQEQGGRPHVFEQQKLVSVAAFLFVLGIGALGHVRTLRIRHVCAHAK